MIRIIFVVVAVAIGVTAVTAQPDPIAARKALMKKNAKHSKAINAMIKGEAPFDAGAVNAAFTQWGDTAAQLPKLFPDNSKGGDTRALPKIWSDRTGFDTRIATLAKAVAAGKAKTTSLEGLKASFPAVGKACADCHEGYRAAAKKKK
jgi:cytochrome c556